jgi:hypothetical protein
VKYLVVTIKKEEADLGPDAEPIRDYWRTDLVDAEVVEAVPCEDLAAVSRALAAVPVRGASTTEDVVVEWNVMELVKGKYVRRAVTFHKGGKTVKEITWWPSPRSSRPSRRRSAP